MLIPPGYTSVCVEEIFHPQFEDLELDILGGDGERTLKDAVHGIILWPKCYIIIPSWRGQYNPSYRSPATATIIISEVVLTTFNITSLIIYTRTIIQFRTSELCHDIDSNPKSPPQK
jgi:hypothetical protein